MQRHAKSVLLVSLILVFGSTASAATAFDVFSGDLDMHGNNITGVTNISGFFGNACPAGEHVTNIYANGTLQCDTDDTVADTDDQSLSEVLVHGNQANTSVDMGGNNLSNLDVLDSQDDRHLNITARNTDSSGQDIVLTGEADSDDAVITVSGTDANVAIERLFVDDNQLNSFDTSLDLKAVDNTGPQNVNIIAEDSGGTNAQMVLGGGSNNLLLDNANLVLDNANIGTSAGQNLVLHPGSDDISLTTTNTVGMTIVDDGNIDLKTLGNQLNLISGDSNGVSMTVSNSSNDIDFQLPGGTNARVFYHPDTGLSVVEADAFRTTKGVDFTHTGNATNLREVNLTRNDGVLPACDSSREGSVMYNGSHWGCDGTAWNKFY